MRQRQAAIARQRKHHRAEIGNQRRLLDGDGRVATRSHLHCNSRRRDIEQCYCVVRRGEQESVQLSELIAGFNC